ncbi:NUDIX hydrolase [Sulfolobus acidocaldarius]|uniref:NUDIX hydrolase n=1 Tax=Sulfolobus acidocaldarius TaxID=2285 RepID=UPI0007862D29|nr:NUDIX hydrolase [Sulfolobus acidocaldarius]
MRIYSSKKFDVLIENFNLPNGKQVEKAFVRHRGSVVIAPFLGPERIILIKQYRPILGTVSYTHLTDVYKRQHLYIATNLTKTTQKLEEYEVIEPFELTIDEAIKMIDEGKIEDGKTILSLLFISRKYQEIRSLLQG